MKQFKLIASACGLALALGTGAASADIVKKADGTPVVVDQGGTGQHNLVGSDTLNNVMDCLVNGCSGVSALGLAQINNYQGLGSSEGERALAGSPNAGEPTCTVGGATDPNGAPETNPGCQEIAPMTREMQSNICEDDISTPGGASGSNTSAESLAICGDGIVVTTDNKAIAQTADAAGSCVTGPVNGFTGNSTNAVPFAPNGSYAGAGKLRRSGTITVGSGSYVIGDNGTGWKDVLRLIYTGCKNTDGTCGTVDRYTRCTNPVRQAVLNNWYNIVDDGTTSDAAVKCDGTGGTPNNSLCNNASNPAAGGLRHAFRRDDASGTTGFFLGTLGLANNLAANLGGRTALVTGLPLKPVAIGSTANMFCDGGQNEGFVYDTNGCTAGATTCTDYSTSPPTPNAVVCPSYGVCPPAPALPLVQPTCTPGTANACRDFVRDNPSSKSLTCPASGLCPAQPALGDPITKPCAPEDNLCSWQGRMGVVQALVSTNTLGGVAPFPTMQCTPNSCAAVSWMNIPWAMCPDGTVPSGGTCSVPVFKSGTTTDFNCMNIQNSRCIKDTSDIDGRAFNFVIKDSAGSVKFLATNLPGVAQWRSDMAVLKTSGIPNPGGPINPDPNSTAVPRARCQQVDATHMIGCVVANTQCTLGYAGRGLADSASAISQGQEPFRINASTPTNTNILNFLADNGLGAAARPANYAFSRFLYLSAIGGFGNITSDCLARGGSSAYCADEVKIANAFFGSNYDSQGGPVCDSAGFLSLPATQLDVNGVAQPLRECRGAINSATCGQVGKTCSSATDCASTETCTGGQCTRQDGSKDPADACAPL